MTNDIISRNEQGCFYDGYMGAIGWKGKKSHLSLWGSELSKAIRAELKEHNIKGVYVKCTTYSGGQSLYITIKADECDYVTREEFLTNYKINYNCVELVFGDGYTDKIDIEKYFTLSREEQDKIQYLHKNYLYDYYKNQEHLSVDSTSGLETLFTKEFLSKIQKIKIIVSEYNHSENNGMVDYFYNNFFDWYSVKRTQKRKEEK